MMSRYLLRGDKWRGTSNESWAIEAPSHPVVEQCIRRLDGVVYTQVSIALEGGAYLSVAGGPSLYVVTVELEEGQFRYLRARGAQATGAVYLNTGGQEVDYPAEIVVDFAQATTASLRFLSDGQLDPEQEWKEL